MPKRISAQNSNWILAALFAEIKNVQMHHIRAVRKYSETARQGFGRIHSLLNRKQVPVCPHHHKAIHDGLYDSISLSELYDSRLGQPESYLILAKGSDPTDEPKIKKNLLKQNQNYAN